MAILTTLLIALLVLVCLLMVLIILMQRPKQEGLGAAFGGGMTDSMFGAQTTDVLQKGTTWLAVIFFCTTIALASIKTREYQAEADKGEGLISNEPAEVTPPLDQMPDLNQPAFDPNIPLPGAGDGSATTPPAGAETDPAPVTTTPGVGLLPPPDAVDASKPAAADDKKPAAAADDKKPAASSTPAPKADAKPEAATKPAAETKTVPADKKPAPTPAAKPAPAPAPATDSGQ